MGRPARCVVMKEMAIVERIEAPCWYKIVQIDRWTLAHVQTQGPAFCGARRRLNYSISQSSFVSSCYTMSD